jgi:23S rRNA G2069 N7-methylase RlmK/C1962 C5-methylase RlmI
LHFYWQAGYAVYSISATHVDKLRRYINTQEEHHRGESFQDEYRRLLEKNDMKWIEQYVWD